MLYYFLGMISTVEKWYLSIAKVLLLIDAGNNGPRSVAGEKMKLVTVSLEFGPDQGSFRHTTRTEGKKTKNI